MAPSPRCHRLRLRSTGCLSSGTQGSISLPSSCCVTSLPTGSSTSQKPCSGGTLYGCIWLAFISSKTWPPLWMMIILSLLPDKPTAHNLYCFVKLPSNAIGIPSSHVPIITKRPCARMNPDKRTETLVIKTRENDCMQHNWVLSNNLEFRTCCFYSDIQFGFSGLIWFIWVISFTCFFWLFQSIFLAQFPVKTGMLAMYSIYMIVVVFGDRLMAMWFGAGFDLVSDIDTKLPQKTTWFVWTLPVLIFEDYHASIHQSTISLPPISSLNSMRSTHNCQSGGWLVDVLFQIPCFFAGASRIYIPIIFQDRRTLVGI